MGKWLFRCAILALLGYLHIDAASESTIVPGKDALSRKTTQPIALPAEKLAPLRIPRFDRPPVIDGKLDDEVWQQAAELKSFYQISPGDNIAPSQKTEVLLGYDSRFLYVAFHAYDDPTKVRANLLKRDDILNDDYVGMLLDT